MTPGDFFIVYVLKRLFDGSSTPAKSPAIVFPPNGGAAVPAAAAPPAAAPAALPASFPANVPVSAPQGTPAPPGFKRAIEVWIVRPDIAKQAESAIVGMDPQIGALTLSMLESQFPKGWQAAKTATAQEAATAKALLAKWKDGGVVFMGPQTPSGRRAFKMTKHPGTPAAPPAPSQAQFPTSAPPAPAAAPAAAAPPAAAPGPVVTTTPSGGTVTTLPEVLITADAPDVTSRGGTPVQQQVTVRKGEGLATIAKRLGKPATAQSAIELRSANVPQGPDANWQNTDLSKGGIKKVGRAGGLQPGDRLFVPPAWGFVDAARL
jgi:hypothetical protein